MAYKWTLWGWGMLSCGGKMQAYRKGLSQPLNSEPAAGDRFALILWVLLVTGFALGSVTRQLTWLMALVALPIILFREQMLAAIPERRQFTLWWLLAFVPMWLALPDAADPERAARILFRYLSYLMAGSLLFLWVPAQRDQRRFLLVTGGLLTLLLLDGLVQSMTEVNIAGKPLYADDRYGWRITGFLGVDFGWVMAVLSPFFLEAARLADPRGRAYWLLLPLLIVGVLLSGSRASLLIMLLGFLAYGVLLSRSGEARAARRFARPVLVGLLFGIGLIVLSPSLLERWSDVSGLFVMNEDAANQALSKRPYIWAAALEVFREHWINGAGVRGYAVLAEPLLRVADLPAKPQGWHAHLNILEVATDLGLIGLLAYVALYGSIVRWLWQAPVIAIAPGLTATLALFPLGSTLPLFSYRVAGVTWLCLAMALAISGRRK